MKFKFECPVVLASQSPRRRKLLSELVEEFEIVCARIEEPDKLADNLTPSQQAEGLAFFKAREVQLDRPGAIVIGADTICACEGDILGKPIDRAEARRMLIRLSGTPHQVITGVALLKGNKRLIASCVTGVTMRPMTATELDDYIASGEWMGKAGAYAIQETADRFVTKIEGSFTNVVGLPLELLERMLRKVA